MEVVLKKDRAGILYAFAFFLGVLYSCFLRCAKKKKKILQSMHCATAKAQSILDPESSVIIAFNAIL